MPDPFIAYHHPAVSLQCPTTESSCPSASTLACRYADAPGRRYTFTGYPPVRRYAGMQICRYADTQGHLYAGTPVQQLADTGGHDSHLCGNTRVYGYTPICQVRQHDARTPIRWYSDTPMRRCAGAIHMCICLYTYVYIYIYLYLSIAIYLYLHLYLYLYLYPYLCQYLQLYIYSYYHYI